MVRKIGKTTLFATIVATVLLAGTVSARQLRTGVQPSPVLAGRHAVRPCTAADSAPAGETAARPRAFVHRTRRQPNLKQSN